MINVRKAHLQDTEKVLAMLEHVWEDDYVPRSWATWVENTSEGIVLVAETEKNIVGTCYIHFMPNNKCWFQGMRVSKDARRLGVGSALTHESLRLAHESGYTNVYLGIDAENTASLTMTAKAGFIKECEYSRVGKTLARLGEGEEKPRTFWRMAKESDVDNLLALGQDSSYQGAIFACWQWQPVSRESFLKVIREEDLWVWEQDGIRIWAGFNHFGEYAALFPMAGEATHFQEALRDLVAWLPGDKEVFLELWQPPNSPILATAQDLEFTGDDGYTIWGYRLKS